MSIYEFQILRYRPDHVSEEFVNVGIVFYEPESRTLQSAFTKSVARITGFFTNQDGRQLQRRLRHLEGMFLAAEPEILKTGAERITDITSRYLTPDDTALYFTPAQQGMDEEPETTFFELFEQLVERHVDEANETVRGDYEVWTKLFKPWFQELGIARQLKEHKVVTPNDTLEFSHSWKNEIWHCYEPVAFNLKRTDSVKNKVYKWVGKLGELQHTDEALEIKLLTAMPDDNPKLLAFIIERLDQKVFGNSRVTIVQPATAERLAETVRAEIGAHDDEAL